MTYLDEAETWIIERLNPDNEELEGRELPLPSASQALLLQCLSFYSAIKSPTAPASTSANS